MSSLRLGPGLMDQIVEHLRREAPLEGCGLIYGQGSRGQAVVPMRNTLASPFRFEMDPLEQIAVAKRFREEGLALLAIYHSHPSTEPYPSATDVEWAEAWQSAWFLIVSLRREEPEARCFRIEEGQVREVHVVEEPAPPEEQRPDEPGSQGGDA